MKAIATTQYQCEICKSLYTSEKNATTCESQPVTRDQGAHMGDIILILTGEGAGETATVNRRIILGPENIGHDKNCNPSSLRYWHTVAVVGDVYDHWGSRYLLPFDAYRYPARAPERLGDQI